MGPLDFPKLFEDKQYGKLERGSIVRKLLERLFLTVTAFSIIQSLWFTFHLLGQYMIFSNDSIEGFRLHGKPFVQFFSALLQIIFVVWIWREIIDLRRFENRRYQEKRLERRHRINLSFGGYYWVMKQKNLHSWTRVWARSWERSKPVLGINVRNGLSTDDFIRKIQRRYRAISFLMITLPVINLLINLIYIIEFTIPIELPLPPLWLEHIQSIIKWLERLWQIPELAFFLCIVEIFVAGYIYFRLFGIPFITKND